MHVRSARRRPRVRRPRDHPRSGVRYPPARRRRATPYLADCTAPEAYAESEGRTFPPLHAHSAAPDRWRGNHRQHRYCRPEASELSVIERCIVKVIAYDRLKPGVTMDTIRPLLLEEVAHAWRLW